MRRLVREIRNIVRFFLKGTKHFSEKMLVTVNRVFKLMTIQFVGY